MRRYCRPTVSTVSTVSTAPTLPSNNNEGEVVGTSAFARAAGRLSAHFGAADGDAGDPVAVWATRFGRVAGLIVFVALAVYLVHTYLWP